MSLKREGSKIRFKQEFVQADVKSLHDHSYATDDDSVNAEIRHIQESCQKILQNQSEIMKDLALLKNESRNELAQNDEITNDAAVATKSSKSLQKKKSQTKRLLIKLPCTTVAEVEDLEAKINESEEFENFIVQYFERIHEYELPKFIKSAFQSIMTLDVAKSFTWHGLNHNRCIKDFKIISILLEISARKFSQAPKEITINFVKKYFLMCKDKSRKKTLRQKKNELKSETS